MAEPLPRRLATGEVTRANRDDVGMMQQLGLLPELAPRLRPHANGATAMRAMAQTRGGTPIGCTQISEIKFADGVTLVGPLPQEFELATVYSIGVCADARQPELARRFARLLSGPESGDLRAAAGFEN